MKSITPVSPWMNFLPEPPVVLSANPNADITVFSSSQVKSFGASINLASAFPFLIAEFYPDFALSATNFSCKASLFLWPSRDRICVLPQGIPKLLRAFSGLRAYSPANRKLRCSGCQRRQKELTIALNAHTGSFQERLVLDPESACRRRRSCGLADHEFGGHDYL